MKSLKKEKELLNSVISRMSEIEHSKDKKDKREHSKLKSNLPLIKSVILYLEGNPTDEYCKVAKANIERKIEILMSRYVKPVDYDKLTKPQISKHLKSYKKEEGVLKLESQLNNLNYILD